MEINLQDFHHRSGAAHYLTTNCVSLVLSVRNSYCRRLFSSDSVFIGSRSGQSDHEALAKPVVSLNRGSGRMSMHIDKRRNECCLSFLKRTPETFSARREVA